METTKVYLFEESNNIKAVVVANDIEDAMASLQAQVNDELKDFSYTRALHLITSKTGISDWQVDVYENYRPEGEQQVLTKDLISMTLDVFVLDFVIGRVFGGI